MNFKLSMIFILAGLAVIFIVQNASVIEVQFLVWSVQVSLALLMFLLLATGFVVSWFLSSVLKYRHAKAKKVLSPPTDGGK